MEQGPSRSYTYARWRRGDTRILLNHAWGLFNHSDELALEESLKESAAVGSHLLENPRLVLFTGYGVQSQHRHSEVNTCWRAGKRDQRGSYGRRATCAEFNARSPSRRDVGRSERLKLALDDSRTVLYVAALSRHSVHITAL